MRRLSSLLAVLVVATVSLLGAHSVAAAATPPVVLESLALPSGVVAGQQITATAKVRSAGGTVNAQAVTIAVRAADGTALDFPGARSATIPTSGFTFTSGARSFPVGTYQVFAAVQVGGTWTNLTPVQNLTVAAGGVVLDTLSVPTNARSGQAVSATAKLRSQGGSVAAQAVTVAVRAADGTALDFPGATAATITAAGYTFTSGKRTFPAGTYQAFTAVQVDGVWKNLTPATTFTIGPNPLTFNQDFTGPAGSNANQDRPGTWFSDPCWANGADRCYATRSAYVFDRAKQDGAGNLVLTADRNTDTAAKCGSVTCAYASARLTMLNWAGNSGRPSWSQTGGRFEARIKAPLGKGLWPAFWSVGDQATGRWPDTGEVDMVELIGDQPRTVHQYVHGGPRTDHSAGAPYTLPTGDISGWHTYAVDWDPSANGYIRWSVDGRVTHTVSAAEFTRSGGSWSSFQGPQALILQLDVGGSWPGAPDGSTAFPARMLVDYVRAYQYPMS